MHTFFAKEDKICTQCKYLSTCKAKTYREHCSPPTHPPTHLLTPSPLLCSDPTKHSFILSSPLTHPPSTQPSPVLPLCRLSLCTLIRLSLYLSAVFLSIPLSLFSPYILRTLHLSIYLSLHLFTSLNNFIPFCIHPPIHPSIPSSENFSLFFTFPHVSNLPYILLHTSSFIPLYIPPSYLPFGLSTLVHPLKHSLILFNKPSSLYISGCSSLNISIQPLSPLSIHSSNQPYAFFGGMGWWLKYRCKVVFPYSGLNNLQTVR